MKSTCGAQTHFPFATYPRYNILQTTLRSSCAERT